MSVFNVENNKHHTQAKMFFDGSVNVQRYDVLKYKQFDKLTDKQLGFFWRPEEVDIVRDSKDFRDLTEHEQHIFTSNLKRQILLDSVQGRSPNLAFLPVVSIPELETWIETWAFSETIHSRSYTHLIRNVYPDPSVIFDQMLNDKEITDCAGSITHYYDNLIAYNDSADHGSYQHKEALYMAIMAANILEGVRFYVSFACSWAFAELKKMEGNAKIIKFIARDENVHMASTQQMLKLLPGDDKDFAKIAKEREADCIQMFMDAIEQEKAWAEYLFKDGSMIGLNAELLKQYVEWIAAKRMRAVGLTAPYSTTAANPLPWTEKWIRGGEVQVAPQETEISSYVIGGTKQDVTDDTFKGMSL